MRCYLCDKKINIKNSLLILNTKDYRVCEKCIAKGHKEKALEYAEKDFKTQKGGRIWRTIKEFI